MNRLNNVKQCRSCLSAIFNGFNIFDTIYQPSITSMQLRNDLRVSDIFEQFTGFNLNENDLDVPKYLCIICLERLFNAYEFFELCKLSDDELKTYSNTTIETNIEVVKFTDDISSKGDDNYDNRLMSDNDDEGSYSAINDDDDDPDFESSTQLDRIIEEDGNTTKSSEQIDRIFDCLKCNEEFGSSAELMRHERIHEGNWSCTECDKVLATKYTFRHHMMLHTGKPFECTVCTRRFSRVADLNRHTRIYHLTGKSYECEKCPKRFYTKSHLVSHKLSHMSKKRKKSQIVHLNQETTINSQSMDKSNVSEGKSRLIDGSATKIKFETESNFSVQTLESQEVRNFPFNINDDNVLHEISQIEVKTENSSRFDTIAKYYRCKKCFKKFRQKSNYLRHLRLIKNCQADLNCRTNPQKCPYCTEISDNVANLRTHLESHMDQDPFRCKICNKNYKTWVKLTEHTRQIHLKKKKYHSNHLCTVCGRGLPSAKLLEEHYFVHQGIRNYKCEYCDRAFYTNSGLKQHSAIHTRDVLQCSECGKTLADKVTLRNHLTIHFGKKFKCSICEKLFPNVSTLNRHLKVHRGERNFQCDRCSKRYMRRGHLNDHIKKVHENPIMMACDDCGMEFNHRGSLNKHRRLEHAEKPIFRCIECGKCFGRKSRLTEHNKKFHTTENLESSQLNNQSGKVEADNVQYEDSLNDIA